MKKHTRLNIPTILRAGAACAVVLLATAIVDGQAPATQAQSPDQVIQQLSQKVAADEARISELERRLDTQPAAPAAANPSPIKPSPIERQREVRLPGFQPATQPGADGP